MKIEDLGGCVGITTTEGKTIRIAAIDGTRTSDLVELLKSMAQWYPDKAFKMERREYMNSQCDNLSSVPNVIPPGAAIIDDQDVGQRSGGAA